MSSDNAGLIVGFALRWLINVKIRVPVKAVSRREACC